MKRGNIKGNEGRSSDPGIPEQAICYSFSETQGTESCLVPKVLPAKVTANHRCTYPKLRVPRAKTFWRKEITIQIHQIVHFAGTSAIKFPLLAVLTSQAVGSDESLTCLVPRHAAEVQGGSAPVPTGRKPAASGLCL